MNREDKTRAERMVVPQREIGRQASRFRAILGSNEKVDDRVLERIADAGGGVVMGVGFGMGLAVAGTIKEFPQKIALFDIDPYVVAGGRMVIELLKESATWEEMIAGFRDKNKLAGLYQAVRLKDLYLQQSTTNWTEKETDAGITVEEFISSELDEFVKESQRDELTDETDGNSLIVRGLKERYQEFRERAINGNMGIWLGDIGNQLWAEAWAGWLREEKGQQVFYLSNTADHVVRGGGSIWQYNHNLEILASNCSDCLWLSTLNSQGYLLEAGSEVPVCLVDVSSREAGDKVFRMYRFSNEAEEELRLWGNTREGITITNQSREDAPMTPVVMIPAGPGDKWSINLYKKGDGYQAVFEVEAGTTEAATALLTNIAGNNLITVSEEGEGRVRGAITSTTAEVRLAIPESDRKLVIRGDDGVYTIGWSDKV